MKRTKLQQERHLFTLIASQQITLLSCWGDQHDGAEQSKTKLTTTCSRVLEKSEVFLLYHQIDCFTNPGYYFSIYPSGKELLETLWTREVLFKSYFFNQEFSRLATTQGFLLVRVTALDAGQPAC